jgi:superfamily II DNA or RNA helicase
MSTSTGTNKTSAEQLDLETARRRCAEVIRRAYETKTNTLVNALPAMGKTHSAVKEAATTGTKVTILTTRGREEQYEKISELCEEFGLDYEVLPSAYEECPILNGNMGEDKNMRLKN